MGQTPDEGSPSIQELKPGSVEQKRGEIENGIYYGERLDEYAVVESGADGQQKVSVFKISDGYDLDYLKRAYRGRLEFKGELPKSKETVKLVEDRFSESGRATRALSKEEVESFDRIDKLMERLNKK